MRYIIVVLLGVLLTVSSAFGQDVRFTKANSLYQDGKFADAKSAYLEILNSGVQSPELLFNLGNACYKNGELSASILYFEKALLLDPTDADIRYNLELANNQIVDKITPVGHFFLVDWINSLRESNESDGWAVWAIITLFLVVGAVVAYLFIDSALIKRIAFFAGIFLLVINITATIFASSQKSKLTNRQHAILFTPSVTVKSSPDLTGSELFVLHEGTKIKILQTLGSWAEIELLDGNVGWLPRDSYKEI